MNYGATPNADYNAEMGDAIDKIKKAASEPAVLSALVADLRARIAELERERDIYKADSESRGARLADALDQLRCPDCKCGDQTDAECKECGCDSPVCARDGSKTLAEAYLAAESRAQLAEGRVGELTKAGADVHELIADVLGLLIPMERSVTPSVLLIRQAVDKLRRATTKLPYLTLSPSPTQGARDE